MRLVCLLLISILFHLASVTAQCTGNYRYNEDDGITITTLYLSLDTSSFAFWALDTLKATGAGCGQNSTGSYTTVPSFSFNLVDADTFVVNPGERARLCADSSCCPGITNNTFVSALNAGSVFSSSFAAQCEEITFSISGTSFIFEAFGAARIPALYLIVSLFFLLTFMLL